ncbi:hypothetical protein AVEN_128585-1 [Araneus ventricosus]|uniref:Uncharacterized protein n=1 Tax=Araneus ventricosus TaxID=182803 RepID=A0A4Y2KBX2_ARAVE|nr:hypothetical protein AVEN_128585-1 [Araneus ventricosus]
MEDVGVNNVPFGVKNDIGPPESSKKDNKNSYRQPLFRIILEEADDESLLSYWQAIIRPSELKEVEFNIHSWLGSEVNLEVVFWKKFSQNIKALCTEEI